MNFKLSPPLPHTHTHTHTGSIIEELDAGIPLSSQAHISEAQIYQHKTVLMSLLYAVSSHSPAYEPNTCPYFKTFKETRIRGMKNSCSIITVIIMVKAVKVLMSTS